MIEKKKIKNCFPLLVSRSGGNEAASRWTGLSVTHPLSSRVIRTKGGFFLWPSGRAVQVAVFAFLEKVGKAGTFIELQIKKRRRKVSVAVLLFR